jgi:3-hydroxyisobutyrate dehydrogenase-like beta-hydroxyacid dehydrogenase
MATRVGIIGLGEAGAAIAAGLKSEGVEVAGFEARMHLPEVAEKVNSLGITVCKDLEELAKSSDLILCLTHAKFAVSIAEELVPLLQQGQVYSDWNSTGPQLKKTVGAVIAKSKGTFVDVAVMGAVPPLKHRVPIIISGSGKARFIELTQGMNLEMELSGDEAGEASATKMLRSILVKGMESLMLEFLLMAREYGGGAKVLEGMGGSMPFDDWNEFATYITSRTYLHARRRSAELGQVITTLEEAGIEPMVASGCEKRLTWVADLELNDGGRQAPRDYNEFIDRVYEKIEERKK